MLNAERAGCLACTDPDCRGEQMHGPGSVTTRDAIPPPPTSGKRRPLDDYPTPEWAIRAIAAHVGDVRGKTVLDPCCGAGAILDVFRELGANVVGIEISEERTAEARAKGHDVTRANALTVEWPRADLIVTNPPFSHAQAFAEKALTSVAAGGTVAFLLRLGFLESKQRLPFHRAHGSSVYVLATRPSFTNGKSDSSAYGWFLWGARHSRTLHFLDAIDPTRRSRTAVHAAPVVRPIPGATGYLATSDGKILSTWRRSRSGQRVAYLADGEPKELNAYDRKSTKGEPTPYRSVMIKWDDTGKRKPAYVHHLIALTFLGPRPEGYEVLHGEKGSSCNAADNLRYGSPDENGAERAHCRGDNWYRSRGLPPPRFKDFEPAGAFDDLLGHRHDLLETGE